MSFGSSSYDGTVRERELKETNELRGSRPVYLKTRKLGGKRGKVARGWNRVFGDSRKEVWVSHWGIQVGPYMWELHTDQKMANTLAMQRLTGSQIWESDVGETVIGETKFTDVEINYLANETLSDMRQIPEFGGKYDMVDNNCQDFAIRLWGYLCPESFNVDAWKKICERLYEQTSDTDFLFVPVVLFSLLV